VNEDLLEKIMIAPVANKFLALYERLSEVFARSGNQTVP
jgi:hypothetical protein